jgi:tRNA (guanine37-N1)-methyltransferase
VGRSLKIEIISLFPRFFLPFFEQSILHRACEAGLLEILIHDLRDYTDEPHKQADDYPFGGGAGMLLMAPPFFRVMSKIITDKKPRPLTIYPTAQGKPFMQKDAEELSREKHLVFLCGHYKGVDQRIVEHWVDREYSIGDYVLTGGEIPTLAMIDAMVRLIPGVLGDFDSAMDDSFQQGMLGCSYYTRPEIIEGMKVPEILLSGHHSRIKRWRQIDSFVRTINRRPEILAHKQVHTNGNMENSDKKSA